MLKPQRSANGQFTSKKKRHQKKPKKRIIELGNIWSKN